MRQDTIRLMFALLRSAICGKSLTEEEKNLYSEELLSELLSVSKKHDIAHLIIFALDFNSLLPKNDKNIKNELFKAIYRYEQMNFEYKRILNTLEESEIPFVPLKGSVLRDYYPKPWMRTSCDIDILTEEKNADKAAQILAEKINYSVKEKGSHEISLFSPNNIHLELHYSLIEDSIKSGFSDLLKNAWKYVVTSDGHDFQSELKDEMFYFYHIAHMAKHFENGGCGIRPFIDLWFLNNINKDNKERRNELLNQGGLLKFAEAASNLSDAWLNGTEHTEITKQFESYILHGGVYGSDSNRITVQQQKKGGKIRYFLSKVFLSYDVIKYQYPILQKHPLLTPIMEVRRWFKLIFCGHAGRVVRELKVNNEISHSEAENTKTFLKKIGL